ncbi:isoprenylcysteine carboxyl methyltransferase family protein [Halalkalibacterium ligniniphilum]|uniref:isoprenylcysteine carboxyl methyltransferase family protein n=1 Tax=Halalkalibacterium ligniniphilum TaxID=1134413 RepID=UPI00034C07F0|nr:isoprenylcysteine carboxyl methyltransferase family protein [Halalkalibacterium ligniniphilum]
MALFYLFIGIVIAQRMVEVIIAHYNARWIKERGGYEAGREHYKYMVALHFLFFLSLIVEVNISERIVTPWMLLPFSLFLVAQIGRIWALVSLGRFWNTRIMILPGAELVARGPYRYLRHPNYVIVMIEFLMLPLMFGAFVTMFVFSILNGVMLFVRVKEEEKALQETTNYQEVFRGRSRFFPTYEK